MVVADLAAVNDTGNVPVKRRNGKRHDGRCHIAQSGNTVFHVLRQIIGVGTGIGQKLLFVECLGVVQYLLGGVAIEPVPVTLEGSQVVELGRLGGFLLFFHLLDNSRLRAAGG